MVSDTDGGLHAEGLRSGRRERAFARAGVCSGAPRVVFAGMRWSRSLNRSLLLLVGLF